MTPSRHCRAVGRNAARPASIADLLEIEMRRAGASDDVIHAVRKTGSVITREGRSAGIYSRQQLREWDSAIAEHAALSTSPHSEGLCEK